MNTYASGQFWNNVNKIKKHRNNGVWGTNFIDKQEMCGVEPAKSAVIAKVSFVENGVKNVLIPGIGYGRNAAFIAWGRQTKAPIESKKPR